MSIEIRGVRQTLQVLQKVEAIPKANISDLGAKLKSVCIKNIKESSTSGYPSNSKVRLSEGVKVSYPGRGKIILNATSKNKKGKGYGDVVEFGGRKSRTGSKSKGAAGEQKYRPQGLMVFIGRDGMKVFTTKAKRQKAHKYMAKTLVWLKKNLKGYFKTRIRIIKDSKGRRDGYGVAITKLR